MPWLRGNHGRYCQHGGLVSMTRPLYTEGPKHVRHNTQAKLDRGDLTGALSYACESGFDVPEPPQHHVQRLEALREAGALVEAAEYLIQYRDAIDQQRRAHLMWLGRRPWAAGPSPDELAAAAKADQEAKDREAAIERRTLEILAHAEEETRAKRLADARKRAEKEMK